MINKGEDFNKSNLFQLCLKRMAEVIMEVRFKFLLMESLYTQTNRGHNSIAIFRVNQDSGKLTFLEAISTEGNWPRDFTLDPTEHFIIVVNERSNNLILFSRNKTTGQLTLVQSNVSVPSPVCVKFLHKE